MTVKMQGHMLGIDLGTPLRALLVHAEGGVIGSAEVHHSLSQQKAGMD